MRFLFTLILYTVVHFAAHTPPASAQDEQAPAPQAVQEPAPDAAPDAALKPVDVIDYNVLANNAAALAGMHQQRTIDLDTFLEMIADENTVLIDVRSAWEYQCAHVDGAVNMSLTDITEESMKQIVPDRDTRIVIYCSDSLYFLPTRRIALTSMAYPVLYELGYANVYELQYGYASGREELSRLPIVTEGPGPEDVAGRYQCSAIREGLGMEPVMEPAEEPAEEDAPEDVPQGAQ